MEKQTGENRAQIRMPIMLSIISASLVVLTFVSLWMLASGTFFASAEEAENIVTATSLNSQNTEEVYVDTVQVQQVGGKRIETVVTPDNHETYILSRDKYLGFEPLEHLTGYVKTTTIIQFSGKTEPESAVTLLFDSKSRQSKMTIADERGMWRIDVPVEALEPGSYTATLRTSKDDVVSDPAVVGNFSIDARPVLSNTTWISFVVAGVILILILLLANATVLYVHHRQEARLKA